MHNKCGPALHFKTKKVMEENLKLLGISKFALFVETELSFPGRFITEYYCGKAEIYSDDTGGISVDVKDLWYRVNGEQFERVSIRKAEYKIWEQINHAAIEYWENRHNPLYSIELPDKNVSISFVYKPSKCPNHV